MTTIQEKHLRIVNYPGTACVRTEIMASYAEDLFRLPENEAIQKLPAIPALHWVGEAKRAELFKWFFTSEELVVTDDDGQKVISRR